ncbi:MAG: VanZ family protein [Acidobacteriota bacterium]
MRRFLPPGVLIAVTLASSPFLALARDALLKAFPSGGLKALAAALGLSALGAIGWGLSRIEDRRALRYGGLALAVALLVLQRWTSRSGLASVDIVEKVHIVQYGLLVILFYRALLPSRPLATPAGLLLPILWTGLAGLAEESVQGFFQLRTGDVRDVWLNYFSGTVGLLFYLSIAPPERWSWRSPRAEWAAAGRWAAALVVAGGLFLQNAHLGHLIEDPEIGRFRSWFTAEQLERLSQDRAERWRRDRPTGLVAWHKEDYFLTEAARHANHRNSAYSHEQWTLAWQANRILERHYEPFLDLDSFRNGGRHRYPPELRADLESKAQPNPATYVSPVQSKRVLLISPLELWSAVGGVAALLLLVPVALPRP